MPRIQLDDRPLGWWESHWPEIKLTIVGTWLFVVRHRRSIIRVVASATIGWGVYTGANYILTRPTPPPVVTTWKIGPGYVRALRDSNDGEGGQTVTFETDTGSIYSFTTCGYARLIWLGMHGKLFMDGCHMQRVDHMPPDVPQPSPAPETKK